MTDQTTLRCLAVKPPFAWAIAVGAKDIENRSWSTDYRGPFVIQASSGQTETNRIAKKFRPKAPPPAGIQYMALIGIADLVDVVPVGPALETSPWAYGRYCWRIANARIFETPIPAKGKLNLYHLDERLDGLARAQIPGAKPAVLSDPEREWLKAMHADPADQRLAFAQNYFELEAWDDLGRVAEMVIADDENNPVGWGFRGISRGCREKPDTVAAIADLDRAVELTKGEMAFWIYYRGLGHGDLGNKEEEQRDLARVRELAPDFFGEDGTTKPAAADTDVAEES